MNSHDFDRLASQFARGGIGRRDFLRRAASLGLGAAAAASFVAHPARALQEVHDPPKPDGWPTWAPWPLPITSGPIIPIPAPAETTKAAGIVAYEAHLHPETGSGWIVGLDDSRQAVSHFYVQFRGVNGESGISRNVLRWAIVDPRAQAGGTLRVVPDGADRARLQGDLNGQRIGATATRDGTISITGKKITVNGATTALLTEWSRIGDAYFVAAQDLGITAGNTSTQAGCGGCLGVGIGLSLSAPACFVTAGCGGVWAGVATAFALNCEGACS